MTIQVVWDATPSQLVNSYLWFTEE